jgi:hypothetical protein
MREMAAETERLALEAAEEVIVIESPSSPSSVSEEDGREWWTDGSDSEGEAPVYGPMCSPITPDWATCEENVATGDVKGLAMEPSESSGRELEASAVQKHWNQSGLRPAQPFGMVAVIRPELPTPDVPLDMRPLDREFRITTQAPIIQTRSVISRIVMRDGSLVEEALHDRFVMARTVATQTWRLATREGSTNTEDGEAGDTDEEVSVASTAGTPLLDEMEE